MENPVISVKATKKEWIGLAVLALPCVLYSMDLNVLNLAVPQLSLDLKPSASQLLWIVDVYGFFLAGSLITMGTLGDRIGRRKTLLIGGSVFALASAVAAFSRSAEMLIATRALQGIAGATLAPSTLSLIRVLFRNPLERALAVGIWGASFSVGGLIAPLIGGVLIEHFWWGSVFLINVPVMILLLIVGPRLLPEHKDREAGKLDLISAGLSLSAILSIIFGLKKIAETDFEALPLFSILLGLFLGTAFIRRQKHLSDPLIEINLFKNFSFNALLATNFLTMFAFFGTSVFITQYMQLVMGLSPLMTGLWSLPAAVGAIISASLLSPLLTRRIKPAFVMALSLFLGTIGFALVSAVNGLSALYLLVSGLFLISLGIPPVVLLATNMILNSSPPEKAGAAAAISETSGELGGAVGIALLGSLGTFIYNSRITNFLLPLTISPALRKTASGTLENAIDAAKDAGIIGQQIIAQAQTAYTAAFQTVMLMAAVILLALAILVLTKLRNEKLIADQSD